MSIFICGDCSSYRKTENDCILGHKLVYIKEDVIDDKREVCKDYDEGD